MSPMDAATLMERIGGGEVIPSSAAHRTLQGIAALADAGPLDVTFCSEKSYFDELRRTSAGLVLVSRRLLGPLEKAGLLPSAHAPSPGGPAHRAVTSAASGEGRPAGEFALGVVDDVELAMARALALFAPPIWRPGEGIDPTARVDATARLGPGCRVGPLVVIGPHVVLGARCVLHPGVVLGAETALGDDCELFPHVVVRERCRLGHRVTVHAGSIIGTDGFGYRWDGRQHLKVPQIGRVVIEDDVEIGSCTCIDRAKFGETVVGRGTKIDNLVQVAHNVRIGNHCIITGQVGLAGSVVVGHGVVFGGQSAVRDHVRLGDGAMVAACSAVAEDVAPGAVVSGLPALPHRQSLREQGALRRLPELVQQARQLQEQVRQLAAEIERLKQVGRAG